MTSSNDRQVKPREEDGRVEAAEECFIYLWMTVWTWGMDTSSAQSSVYCSCVER